MRGKCLIKCPKEGTQFFGKYKYNCGKKPSFDRSESQPCWSNGQTKKNVKWIGS